MLAGVGVNVNCMRQSLAQASQSTVPTVVVMIIPCIQPEMFVFGDNMAD